MNQIDKLIAGLAILRSKATSICFYNSDCGNMILECNEAVDETDKAVLHTLGWHEGIGNSWTFSEGNV